MERLALQQQAMFEGQITVAWHKFCQHIGMDLGDSDDENVYFLCFQAGACEGGLIANDIWQKQLGIYEHK